MKLIRGNIFSPEGIFIPGEVQIEDGRIVKVTCDKDYPLSVGEMQIKIIPGLVDIHSHGCMGHDTCEASVEELEEMLAFEQSVGVTSYCPTTMTYGEDKLLEIIERLRTIKEKASSVEDKKDETSSALSRVLVGCYLEGPFISHEKKGAQNPAYIQKPNKEMLENLVEAGKDLVKVVAIAPEVEGAIDLIKEVGEKVRFSLAHTNTSYDIAKAAFEAGAKQVTHLYNAMPAYNHREPGLIGAAFDSSSVMTELIADGIHVHDAVIRNTFRQLGSERVILISDSMEATGMPNGTYALGGQTVYMKDKKATLEDGTIAGSASTLMDCMHYAIAIGVKESDAIFAATRNPAKAIGIYDQVGSIEEGKEAKLLVCDENLNLKKVICGDGVDISF